MGSQDNPNWLFDCSLIDDITAPNLGFSWSLPEPFNSPPIVSVEIDVPFGDSEGPKENTSKKSVEIDVPFGDSEGPKENTSKKSVEIDVPFGDSEGPKENTSKKRGRTESCGPSSSKACREKLRRDKLNDKFMELCSILDPGRPPKTDKAAILIDAIRMVTQLRSDAQKLKDSNLNLLEKIKELKVEKTELRDEKQRLKVEKDKLEQQLKTVNTPQPSFIAPPTAIPAPFGPPAQVPGGKLVSCVNYPGFAMWQFMPPASVDTSQDHVLHPPVA